jgi:NadR type nicotinamide-nucleotide adenylyltransferase
MIKIAILGPESTGKTELARQLAEFLNCPWVPEYAREYIENLKSPYTYEDVCKIALKQIEEERVFEQSSTDDNYVFFDTDLIITKVWFEYRFGKVPDFLTEQMKTGFFDLYLLCAADLPWEDDPVREHGNDRDYFFDWYKNEIEQTGKPYVIISGSGNSRVQNALSSIKNQNLGF